jgi:hypothetical protein
MFDREIEIKHIIIKHIKGHEGEQNSLIEATNDLIVRMRSTENSTSPN